MSIVHRSDSDVNNNRIGKLRTENENGHTRKQRKWKIDFRIFSDSWRSSIENGFRNSRKILILPMNCSIFLLKVKKCSTQNQFGHILFSLRFFCCVQITRVRTLHFILNFPLMMVKPFFPIPIHSTIFTSNIQTLTHTYDSIWNWKNSPTISVPRCAIRRPISSFVSSLFHLWFFIPFNVTHTYTRIRMRITPLHAYRTGHSNERVYSDNFRTKRKKRNEMNSDNNTQLFLHLRSHDWMAAFWQMERSAHKSLRYIRHDMCVCVREMSKRCGDGSAIDWVAKILWNSVVVACWCVCYWILEIAAYESVHIWYQQYNVGVQSMWCCDCCIANISIQRNFKRNSSDERQQ